MVLNRSGLVIAVLVAGLATGAGASEQVSQDDILAAVRRGDIRPLSEIEDAVRGKLPGEVIKVEVERERGVWTYEFKTLDGKGRRHDVHVDALSGKILEIRRK